MGVFKAGCAIFSGTYKILLLICLPPLHIIITLAEDDRLVTSFYFEVSALGSLFSRR